MSDTAFLSATELARRIRERELSSVELLLHYFDRVDRYNGALNAIVVELREEALKAARSADAAVAKGVDLPPFHGVPMTVKESYNVAGTPTTWGNPGWKDNIAKEDAESVKRLKDAGVVLFGKTNVPLALADFQSFNAVYGTTNNPYDHARAPGGSSGGSAAALAAGLTALEAGSDIGGSIRNPAHFCGVFGHKPTWNLLWMRGHAPPGDIRATSDISVIGPLGRSAEDLETAVRTMAGPDDIMARGYTLNLPTLERQGLKGLRIALWEDDEMCPVSAETKARVLGVARACRDAGAEIIEGARPDFTSEHSHETYQNLLQATMASRMPEEEYASLLGYVADLDPRDTSRTARVLRAQVARFRHWKQNHELREHLRWKWHRFFLEHDLLITPMMPTSAFPHDHRPISQRTIEVDGARMPYMDQIFWAGLTGVAYLPSTVIPTGLDDAGLPIGVQLVGPEYGDLITIGVARELESAGFRFVPPPAYA